MPAGKLLRDATTGKIKRDPSTGKTVETDDGDNFCRDDCGCGAFIQAQLCSDDSNADQWFIRNADGTIHTTFGDLPLPFYFHSTDLDDDFYVNSDSPTSATPGTMASGYVMASDCPPGGECPACDEDPPIDPGGCSTIVLSGLYEAMCGNLGSFWYGRRFTVNSTFNGIEFCICHSTLGGGSGCPGGECYIRGVIDISVWTDDTCTVLETTLDTVIIFFNLADLEVTLAAWPPGGSLALTVPIFSSSITHSIDEFPISCDPLVFTNQLIAYTSPAQDETEVLGGTATVTQGCGGSSPGCRVLCPKDCTTCCNAIVVTINAPGTAINGIHTLARTGCQWIGDHMTLACSITNVRETDGYVWTLTIGTPDHTNPCWGATWTATAPGGCPSVDLSDYTFVGGAGSSCGTPTITDMRYDCDCPTNCDQCCDEATFLFANPPSTGGPGVPTPVTLTRSGCSWSFGGSLGMGCDEDGLYIRYTDDDGNYFEFRAEKSPCFPTDPAAWTRTHNDFADDVQITSITMSMCPP